MICAVLRAITDTSGVPPTRKYPKMDQHPSDHPYLAVPSLSHSHYITFILMVS